MNSLIPIEHKSQRVLTTQQLAEGYETEPIKIQQNFSNNRDRYIAGTHYFILEGEELRRFKSELENFEVAPNANRIFLWTEKGALLHAKSLNTDKAWDVYNELVDTYFRKQSQRLPATYSEALRELADKVDENLQLKAENAELKPAADLGNAMRSNDGLIIIRDFVKVLANVGIKIRQCDLFSWLVKKEYLYQNKRGDYKPRVEYVHSGLFKVAETPVETRTNGSFISYTTRLTTKGQEYFINKLKGEFPCRLQ